MKIAPIIISRTRNADYNGFFCLPQDLRRNQILTRVRNAVYANDLQLISGDNRYVKIIINDGIHVVIGIVSIIEDIIGKDTDLQLDNFTSSRTLWGFIGGTIKADDYQKHPHAIDLDNSFYKKAFMDMVYTLHWTDAKFEGPYPSSYDETATVDIPEAESPFPTGEQIISSENNTQAVNFILNAIHEGRKTSLVTNAEYSATKNILDGHIDHATVGMARVDKMRLTLQEKRQARTAISSKTKKQEKEAQQREFQMELKELCKQHGMGCSPIRNPNNREIMDGWIITPPGVSIKKEFSILPFIAPKISYSFQHFKPYDNEQ